MQQHTTGDVTTAQSDPDHSCRFHPMQSTRLGGKIIEASGRSHNQPQVFRSALNALAASSSAHGARAFDIQARISAIVRHLGTWQLYTLLLIVLAPSFLIQVTIKITYLINLSSIKYTQP